MNMNEPMLAEPLRAPIEPTLLRQRVRHLPAFPQAAQQVLGALRDERLGVEVCAAKRSRDAALAARVLRLANSAFYGVSGRVGSIGDAIQMLGRRTVGAVLTTAAVSSQFGPTACAGFDAAGFWRHSTGVALASHAIARALIADEEIAFTAGLMHDIGRLALAAYYPAEMAAAIGQSVRDDTPWSVAEHEVMGIDHAVVGTLIAEHWHFPAQVVQAIAQHHRPPLDGPAGGDAVYAQIVHVADAVAHALDLAGDLDEAVPEVDQSAWHRMALSPAQFTEVFRQTERGVEAMCQALGL